MNSRNRASLLLFLAIFAAVVLFLYKHKITIQFIQDIPLTLSNNDDVGKIKSFYNKLKISERKVFSQNNEDGVTEAIFDLLNIKNLKKYFVEIGTGPGTEYNTRYLKEQKQWTGVLFDQAHHRPDLKLYRESIHYTNVLDIFKKYEIPEDIDLFSEDTDYADYWIVEKVLSKHKPKVVIHEVNQQTPDKCVTVPKNEQIHIHDGSNFHGANICAFYCLAIKLGYSMVYCESVGVNCFWIRNDLIENNLKLNVKLLQSTLNIKYLYKQAQFSYPETGKKWHQVERCD